jgi:poly(3-hydroxybutyrate) depolymerase
VRHRRNGSVPAAVRRLTKIIPLAVALAVAPAMVEAGGPKITKESLVSAGKKRTYYLFIPDRPAGASPAPVIVMLHGSGRSGSVLLDHWKGLAQKDGIVLAGPEASDAQVWAMPVDGPDLLRDVVEAVGARTAIDPRRVYLFGHSAGACFALQVSLIESTYFAAAAIHAGQLEPEGYRLTRAATRKIPIFIQIGTEDAFFPLAGVRSTRAALAQDGLPVEIREIPRHNHNYYLRSKDINEQAWAFLTRHFLETDPKYITYAIPAR